MKRAINDDMPSLYVVEGSDNIMGRERLSQILMMTVGILRRSATDKEPETSPATRVFDRCMRIGVRSRMSNNGGYGGGGDCSMGLRR
jgi:hypothetical protein